MIKKIILTSIILTITYFCHSQSQRQSLDKAQEAYESKNFSKATDNFKEAFSIKESSNYFDYYYAGLSAIQIDNQSLAIKWLNESIQKGLGSKKGEVDFIKSQKEFEQLHQLDEWKKIISKLETNQKNTESKKFREKEKWLSNIINKEKKTSGFNLYFQKIDSLYFPYLIYFPKAYQANKAYPLITFLHGGTGDEAFYQTYSNPNLQNEPIFTTADKLGAIVIYPIARNNFNWLSHEKSVEEITNIVEKTIGELKIDKENILIGGMSNGGRATFWFTQLDKSPFTGFFAFSAYPSLEYKKIDFTKINNTKPFITVNAKDDSTFPLPEVSEVYEREKKRETGWDLRVIEKGTHGFIYNQEVNGQDIVTKTVLALMKH